MTARALAAAVAFSLLIAAPAVAAPLDVDLDGPRVLPRGPLTKQLPGRGPAAVSFDLRMRPGSRVKLFGAVDLRRTKRSLIVTVGKRRRTLRARSAVHHVEALAGARARVAVDGTVVGAPAARRRFVVESRGGRTRMESYLASPVTDRGALLLHRLAAWRAVTPPGKSPLGVGADGSRRFHPGWTRGFWPGALWQASDLVRRDDRFGDWALAATRENIGAERDDTHDLGFMYGRSSVAAHERLCGSRHRDCAILRGSGLDAADALAALAGTNQVAGMIPTRSRTPCRDCTSLDEADTIIDSMMNAPLLLWAAAEDPGGRGAYRDIALRHADQVTRHLVRPDGSTAQSVHVDRRDGRVLRVHTHQGFSDASAWARGQGWGLYGFAHTALDAREPRLLDVAERLASFVASRNPRGAVPPYDYDAPAGAPTDTSAAVITAAGLLRLEEACRRLGRCDGRARRWGDLGERMLGSALAQVRTRPPLGMLGGQVHSLGGAQSWDDSGEFIFGLDFALEAVRRANDR